MRSRIVSAIAGALLLTISPAALATTDAEDEPQADLLHADLPLYDISYEQVWPRSFSNANGDFGCISRIRFGTWTFTDREGETEAWQISNYGVFHCAAIFREAQEKSDLKEAQYVHGLVVLLGTVSKSGKPIELWAFQKGMIPGSEYILLSRATDKDMIKTFSVLQRACPDGQMRKLPQGQSLDIWPTSYCAIASRAELLALAKKMLERPPLGKLEWSEAEPETEPETESESD
jgi:hypothetical protein